MQDLELLKNIDYIALANKVIAILSSCSATTLLTYYWLFRKLTRKISALSSSCS